MKKLRTLRDARKLSQLSLAKRAGVSVDSIRGYEQGRSMPTLRTLQKLARALGVQPQALL